MSDGVDLAGLIERFRSIDCDDDDDWCSCRHQTQAERDEIVLALRVLRVLRHNGVLNVSFKAAGTVMVLTTAKTGKSWLSLDDAERILDIGGGA